MNRPDLEDLVLLLEIMPLALMQATAYIKCRGRRSSVWLYITEFQANQLSQLNLLDRDMGNHRRDAEATHPSSRHGKSR